MNLTRSFAACPVREVASTTSRKSTNYVDADLIMIRLIRLLPHLTLSLACMTSYPVNVVDLNHWFLCGHQRVATHVDLTLSQH